MYKRNNVRKSIVNTFIISLEYEDTEKNVHNPPNDSYLKKKYFF